MNKDCRLNAYTITQIRMFDEWKYSQGWEIDNRVQGLIRYKKKGESNLTFDQLFEKYSLIIQTSM